MFKADPNQLLLIHINFPIEWVVLAQARATLRIRMEAK